MSSALVLDGVEHRYGGPDSVAILSSADLRIDAGEHVVLTGRSGSGKSTLIGLISGMAAPCAGRITIRGQPMAPAGPEERAALRRKQLGIIYQQYNLVPTLTAAENLLLPLALNGLDCSARRAADWLRRVGLAGLESRYPDQLSGGEQQRVAIARALIHQPALVLADEPTAALDADNARQVTELLVEQATEHGAALLLATHRGELIHAEPRHYRIEDARLQRVALDA